MRNWKVFGSGMLLWYFRIATSVPTIENCRELMIFGGQSTLHPSLTGWRFLRVFDRDIFQYCENGTITYSQEQHVVTYWSGNLGHTVENLCQFVLVVCLLRLATNLFM